MRGGADEFISPEGLRVDGRRAGEVRRLRCKLGPLSGADGSAYFEQGNTKVLVRVTGPRELSHRLKTQHDRALLTCDFSALPFAGGQHRPQGRGDRNAAEIAMCVRQIFEPVVQTHLYPRAQIDISISVLEADGDARAAVINAASLALVDAGVAMEDLVCACSAGIASGSPIVDLNGQEAGGCAEMVVALLPRTGKLSFVQLESKLPIASVEEVMSFAGEGCRQVHEVLSSAIQLHAQSLLYSRGKFST
jgi:exosome complex component RRP41